MILSGGYRLCFLSCAEAAGGGSTQEVTPDMAVQYGSTHTHAGGDYVFIIWFRVDVPKPYAADESRSERACDPSIE